MTLVTGALTELLPHGDHTVIGESHRSDLNRRPLDYESSALPLSYGGGRRNGAEGTRTPGLLGAIQALSQLSYSPVHGMGARGLEPLTSTMST